MARGLEEGDNACSVPAMEYPTASSPLADSGVGQEEPDDFLLDKGEGKVRWSSEAFFVPGLRCPICGVTSRTGHWSLSRPELLEVWDMEITPLFSPPTSQTSSPSLCTLSPPTEGSMEG